ncbi:putative stress response protein, TerZ- and CABP1 [Xenococcus sp. PCC 7305]|uniref:TerD family protein n=1 Tax=Xenococcus sp. PCC 7305 TaxID=102125 RepID=UPI0002ACD29C|nr:TerD family protein [Xenococcus sp. PCC 7305]ELS02463.1 putative stress response protein, TerZ- and CABP1 [Xenococcus sp. PCC 7305]
MAISLEKGQRISLTKNDPGLSEIMCGLGWDVMQPSKNKVFGRAKAKKDFDLDSSVICLDANQKLADFKDIVCFSNLKHSSGAIIHSGDNLTGLGDGDDEVITINLAQIPDRISRLMFVVNIYKCLEREHDFSLVQNAFVRLVNIAAHQELARYNLSGESYKGMTGMKLAEVYRHNGEWKMVALGDGFQANNLQDIASLYEQ